MLFFSEAKIFPYVCGGLTTAYNFERMLLFFEHSNCSLEVTGRLKRNKGAANTRVINLLLGIFDFVFDLLDRLEVLVLDEIASD